MANFLTKTTSGLMQLVGAISSSLGAVDANKIIETNLDGLIDSSLLPPGVGDNVKAGLTAGEALVAGDFVYIETDGQVFKADNSSIDFAAVGFVLAPSAASDVDVTVYFSGVNTFVTVTPGVDVFLGTNGGIALTPPAFAVNSICQLLGHSVASNELLVEIDQPIEYANQA